MRAASPVCSGERALKVCMSLTPSSARRGATCMRLVPLKGAMTSPKEPILKKKMPAASEKSYHNGEHWTAVLPLCVGAEKVVGGSGACSQLELCVQEWFHFKFSSSPWQNPSLEPNPSRTQDPFTSVVGPAHELVVSPVVERRVHEVTVHVV